MLGEVRNWINYNGAQQINGLRYELGPLAEQHNPQYVVEKQQSGSVRLTIEYDPIIK